MTYKAASEESTAEEVCLKCKETSEEMFFLKNCKHKFCETCLEEGMMRDLEDDDEVNIPIPSSSAISDYF